MDAKPGLPVNYCFTAPVAQLDRVSVSEAEGRGFDSRRARQILQLFFLVSPLSN